MTEQNRVNSGELLFDPLPDSTGRSPSMDNSYAKIACPNYLLGWKPLPDQMVIHIPGHTFERVSFQKIEKLDSFPVAEVNQHIGTIAVFRAQSFEFVCRPGEVSVGYYNDFHYPLGPLLLDRKYSI
jgi:hypothetical protein